MGSVDRKGNAFLRTITRSTSPITGSTDLPILMQPAFIRSPDSERVPESRILFFRSPKLPINRFCVFLNPESRILNPVLKDWVAAPECTA